jgi:hypothetical protein
MKPGGRAERRRLMRRAVARWKRFLRDLRNGHSWKPFRGFASDELHLFASRLASRRITWQGSDKGWKRLLRRRRKQQEAESLRIELEADDPSESDA